MSVTVTRLLKIPPLHNHHKIIVSICALINLYPVHFLLLLNLLQRLEFLGDAVLDILITLYLYQNHTDVDPGELTDLRSASVNNQNFALAAVRANLHPHLEHCSGVLESQILAFEKSVSNSSCNADLLMGGKAPKVCKFCHLHFCLYLAELALLQT